MSAYVNPLVVKFSSVNNFATTKIEYNNHINSPLPPFLTEKKTFFVYYRHYYDIRSYLIHSLNFVKKNPKNSAFFSFPNQYIVTCTRFILFKGKKSIDTLITEDIRILKRRKSKVQT